MSREDTQLKPGQSGNPAGKPKGARNKLSESFLNALNLTFEELVGEEGLPAGVDSLRQLRKEQPAQYHNIIAKLMPKLMELSGPDGQSLFPEKVGVIGRKPNAKPGETK